MTWQILILGGLSLSLGWGIRGNFGHETGAAIPGALASMAVVLMSGRPDWWARIPYFAMFGAIGWGFGGSMSYMHVISYTHSGHPASVLYGFANLFVIGFLWAALGGAGTALPAFISGENLSLFFMPVIAIFVGWGLKTFILRLFSHVRPMRRHESRLYWYDTDWLAALIALVATLIVMAFRGGPDAATSLILHLSIGWYAAFLLLVNVFKLRMTPPRGDNWAGCVGMVAGLLIYCWRHSLGGLAFATLAALIALVATLIVIAFRGGPDAATSLILHLAIGWYAAFLLLVNVFKLRMTPPRGDNWAGCVGMVAGLLIYCWRHSLGGLAFATLATGFIGGIGYAFAQLLKLIYIRTGLKTNWHSVLEQMQGLFHGIGLAVSMGLLATRAPRIPDNSALRPWMLIFSIVFVLVLLTYLNHRKATGTWVEQVKSLPEKLYRIPVSGYLGSRTWIGWFELIYIAIGAAVIWLLAAHIRRPLAFIPATWLGKGQLFYLIFMWWVVIFNFERALVGFTPQRLVTEGVITFNALICTLLVALGPQTVSIRELPSEPIYSGWILRAVIVGLIAAIVIALAEWGITHAIYRKEHAPGAGLNIRFGPGATATKARPRAGQEHP